MSILSIRNIFIFATIILSHCINLSAQSTDISSILSHRKQQIESNYYKTVNVHQLIKNGKNYYNYYPSTGGHQFLVSKISDRTTIVYEGIDFTDVSLNYDIYNDELLTTLDKNSIVRYLILDKDKVSKFILEGMLFINWKDNEDTGLQDGLYFLAYDGKVKLMIKKRKEKSKMGTSTHFDNLYSFVRVDKYYLINELGVHSITGKKDLIESFQNQTAAKDFIKQKKMKLRIKKDDFAGQIITVLGYMEKQ